MTKREYVLKELKKYEVDIFEVIKNILKTDIKELYLEEENFKKIGMCCGYINTEYNQRDINGLATGSLGFKIEIINVDCDPYLELYDNDMEEITHCKVVIDDTRYYGITGDGQDYFFVQIPEFYEDLQDFMLKEIIAKATPRQVITYEY